MSRSASGYEAFLWTASGGMVGLGDLPGGSFRSEARAISSDGTTIVGGAQSASGTEPFRWTASAGMVSLGGLTSGSFEGSAQGVSDDGSVVVGLSLSPNGVGSNPYEAFRWTQEEGMVGLGDLPGGAFHSGALAVSADGSVVVGFSDPIYTGASFIWDAQNGMRNLEDVLTNDYGLDLGGWRLFEATDISADGLTITGTGYNPGGGEEAWIAHLPEPGTLALLACGGLLGLRRRR